MSCCVLPEISYHGSVVTIIDPETGEILWEIYSKQPLGFDDGSGSYSSYNIRARSIDSRIIFQSSYVDDSIEDNPMHEDKFDQTEDGIVFQKPRKIFSSGPIRFDNPYDYDAFIEHADTNWGTYTRDYFFRIDIIDNYPLDPSYMCRFFNPEGKLIIEYLLPSEWEFLSVELDLLPSEWSSSNASKLAEVNINAIKRFSNLSTLVSSRSLFVTDSFLTNYISWLTYFNKLTIEGSQFYCLGESSGENFNNTSVFFDKEIEENGETYQLDNGPFGASQTSVLHPIVFNGDTVIFIVQLYYANNTAEPKFINKVKLASFTFDNSFSSLDQLEQHLKDNYYGEELRFDPQGSFSFGSLNWIIDTEFDNISLGDTNLYALFSEGKAYRVINSSVYKNSDNFVLALATNDLDYFDPSPTNGYIIRLIGYNFGGEKQFDTLHTLEKDRTLIYANLTTDEYLFMQEEKILPDAYLPSLKVYDMYSGNLVQSFPYYINLPQELDTDLVDKIWSDVQIDGIPRFDTRNVSPYFKNGKLFYNAYYYDEEKEDYFLIMRACNMDGIELWHTKYLFNFLGTTSPVYFQINMEGMYKSLLSNCRLDDNNYLVVIHPSYYVRPGSNHEKLKQDLELYSYHEYLLHPNKDNTPSSLFGGSLFG